MCLPFLHVFHSCYTFHENAESCWRRRLSFFILHFVLELGSVTKSSPFISQVVYYYYCTFHKKPHCQRHTSDSADLVWWWLNELECHFIKSLSETVLLEVEAKSGSPCPRDRPCVTFAIILPDWLQRSIFKAQGAGRGPGLTASTVQTYHERGREPPWLAEYLAWKVLSTHLIITMFNFHIVLLLIKILIILEWLCKLYIFYNNYF